MGMLMEATEKRMEDPGVPKMATKMPAWEEEGSMEKSYTEKRMEEPSVPKMAIRRMNRPMTAEQQAEQDEMNAREMDAQMKMSKVAAKAVGKSMPRMAEEKATNSTIDIRPITIAVNNLNTTINKVLTAIESRLKKNDVNSQLKKMTQFISEINDSLPMPTSGGGTRRANIKKQKKTLRSRKNL